MLLATKEQVRETRAQDYPSQSWLTAALEETKYTPDAALLFRQKYWPFFIYGEEQPGFPRSLSLVGDLPTARWTAYSFDKFSCYTHRVGRLSHPIALATDMTFGRLGLNLALPLHIRGVLVPCPPSRFLRLDRYRQNGLMYQRIWTRCVVRYSEHDFKNGAEEVTNRTYIQRCWMYVAKEDHWISQLDAGCYYPIMDRFKHSAEIAFNPHYAFTQDVYQDKKLFEETVNNETLYKEYLEQINRKTKVPRVRKGR